MAHKSNIVDSIHCLERENVRNIHTEEFVND